MMSMRLEKLRQVGLNLLIAFAANRAPVVLSGIAEDDPRPKPTSRSRVA
jgi:hypothetical protein